MSGWSGPRWYVRMLEGWEAQGVIKRGAPAQPPAPKPEPKPTVPTGSFHDPEQAKRGSCSPLGGRVGEGW
jgi:hypothetical protein